MTFEPAVLPAQSAGGVDAEQRRLGSGGAQRKHVGQASVRRRLRRRSTLRRSRPPSRPSSGLPPAGRRRSHVRIAAASRTNSSECPPRVKKSSSMLVTSTPSTSENRSQRRCCSGVSGARPVPEPMSWRRQRLPVELAAGGQREGVEFDERRRDHVHRQRRRRVLAKHVEIRTPWPAPLAGSRPPTGRHARRPGPTTRPDEWPTPSRSRRVRSVPRAT